MIGGLAYPLLCMRYGSLRASVMAGAFGNADWTSPVPNQIGAPRDCQRGPRIPPYGGRDYRKEFLALLGQRVDDENNKRAAKEKAMPKEQCFYVVWRIGGEAPTRTHDSYDAAKTEARRLALKCRGEKFAVLKSVSSHVSLEVIDTEHSEDLEPPF